MLQPDLAIRAAPDAGRARAWPLWPVLLFGLAYGALAQLGLNQSTIASNVTLIWPPSGLALYVVLRHGARLWPGIVLGDLLGNAGTGAPILSVLGISAGNIAEAVLVAWVLERRLGFHADLRRVRDVLTLLAVGSAGAIVSALFGPASLVLGGAVPPELYATVCLQWIMGDATGVLVFTPLLLAWDRWRPARTRPSSLAEPALLALLVLAVCAAVFGGLGGVRQGDYPAALAIFPLTVWAALRFGLRGATAVTLAVSVSAVWSTVHGLGPFVDSSGVDSLVRWWVFANVITVTGLVLSASRSERAQAEAELASERDFFSAVLDVQGALVLVLDRAGRIVRANLAFETLTGTPLREAVAAPFSDRYVPPDQRDKVDGHLELLRLGVSNRVRYDATLQRRHGDPLQVSWSNTALRDRHGQLSHVILTGIDITERARALDAVRAARRDLEARVRERTGDLARTNAELQNEITERRRLEREVIAVAEREQTRIGQELHDGLGQQLTAIAFLAEVLAMKLDADGHDRAPDAARIERLASAAVSEARLLARGLAPVELDAGGLMHALEQLADTARTVFGLDARFVCDAPVPVRDTHVAINLYRIAQEAVTNAAKHGGGRAVRLELAHEAGGVRLVISDDGGGFAADAGAGMGLRTMRYRAGLLGGTLDIHQTPGAGTRVAVRVPPDAVGASPAPFAPGAAHV